MEKYPHKREGQNLAPILLVKHGDTENYRNPLVHPNKNYIIVNYFTKN